MVIMKILFGFLLIILILAIGCSSRIEPQYALIGPEESSTEILGNGISIKDGWEFRFPVACKVQKAAIDYEGSLIELAFYSETERGWQHIKSLSVEASSPLVTDLKVNSGVIRVFPVFSGKGRISFCQFYIGKKQKVFSIPLEKPPFVE